MLGSWYCQAKTKTSINKGQGVWGPFKTSLQSVSKFQLLQYVWLQLPALEKALLRPPSHNVTLWDDVWLPVLLYFEFHSQSLSMLFPNCANSCTPDMRRKDRTIQNAFHYKIVIVGSNCSGKTVNGLLLNTIWKDTCMVQLRMFGNTLSHKKAMSLVDIRLIF